MKKLEEKKNSLNEQIKPLEVYLKAFDDAINEKNSFSKKELEKQVVGLIAKYKLLEQEKKTTDMDREYLFSELRKYEKKIPELQKFKDFVNFVYEYAPDKFAEAKTVANERKEEKDFLSRRKFNNFYKY